MFLFLSKLLPLFFYPLGIISICLLVSLVMVWKRPRTAALAITLALIVLLFSSNAWVARLMVRSLEWQNLPLKEIPTAEAIVVLGGATKPALPPRPTVDLNEHGDRVIYAAQLYRQKKAPVIILSGGRIDWAGEGPSESADMATILTSIGIPSEAIIEEPNSLNTYQNAVNVKKILDSRGIHHILLVTSAIHMPRSLLIFKRQGIDAIPTPTDFIVSQADIRELSATPKGAILNLLPDTGNINDFTGALKEYIGIFIYRLRGWA
ncbi:YdcF family protein [Aetokthonos hydrillicola Thurmond2011]|uniref:YdcF family protein n=1 Tax=Aetokthonos hydrillicola Thurmond2011 TaxID=2712845 RepID=A0AAP5IHW9_9CYAN|nr:YdcF family protein [Aetokthonos hydrillicola]MBO3461693.1 YdcF family protein [Aetokthonos hydrillicola CCALA 1050]MBW4590001.1 YdcF family protein [Aetokthonos hydrillicola CCALA 1050]MDR9900583.1 YdcF family protein [Aetokthonos hydrillicola Thurmond2011]